MNIQDYVLQELTYKLLKETLREPNNLGINECLGKLAIDIVEETNDEYKELLINQYNSLKKLKNLDIDNLTNNDLRHETRKVLIEKIDRMVGTILYPTVK